MHILQTRPQGEASAVEALRRRRVDSVSPTETHRERRRRGGQTVIHDRKVRIMPGYVVAKPETAHDLDAALGDMAIREPRRDVTRVVGRINTRFDTDAIGGILAKHGGVIEPKAGAALQVGGLAKITAGALQGFQVRIEALRANKARVRCGQIPAEVSTEHLEPVQVMSRSSGT